MAFARWGNANTEREGVTRIVKRDTKTGLPVIECKQAAAPDEEMTSQRVAEVLLGQEVEWHHDAGR